MIIDTHVHFGKKLLFDMPKENVIKAMTKYNITASIVSNIESAEGDHKQIVLPPEDQVKQEECLKNAIAFAKNNLGKIYIAAWVKPKTEKISNELESLIANNLDIIKAIKVHPFHSCIDFDGPETKAYIELARKYKLPIVTHTGGSDGASCKRVYNAAIKYPEVNFVMVHMGLGTDNTEAIELISKQSNLYGDTTWVSMENTIKCINKTGSNKIMFGSDMPIDGLDTYLCNSFGERSIYQDYFHILPTKINKIDYENIMWKNASKIFSINLK